ncbi:MAG TPA: ATP-binding cassette domain-containing protein [Acidimicrobiales bacterium]|nr:ATP-binding cassette domain-containing protein [Acidimicrobiales bacterium]
MSAIETRSLRKEFAGGVVAVDGIDLRVAEGRIFGFLGPNGAGKSTTVRMLTTLLRPTSGSARVAGLDVVADAHQVRRRIGVALQDAGLDAMATGRELLVLQARLHGLSGAAPARRAAELLALVGLEEAADRLVKTYSGGMKRRLDLASALVHGPSVLFLDEPTAGLDPASREAVWEEVQRLNREDGITVFLTTQYLEEADRMAHELAIIDRGRIVAGGTPQQLKRSVGADMVTVEVPPDNVPAARQALAACEGVVDARAEGAGITLFVTDGTKAAAQAIRLLDRAGIGVSSVSVSAPTLDEVFLRATGFRLEGAGAGQTGEAA